MSFFRNTILVTVLNILGLCLSFLVSIIITWKFGASYNMDSYTAAITIPNYITVVLGGALSYTFIPIFVKKQHVFDNWEFVNNVISIFVTLICFILILGIWFSPEIMKIIAPGFKNYQIEYSAELLKLYFPMILFSCINELFASIFYAKNKFLTPLINKLISPAITIMVIYFSPRNLNVKSLIYVTLASALIQLILLLTTLIKKENFALRFKINVRNQEIIQLFKVLLPLLFSSLIYKIFPIIDSILLSKLPIGSYSRINYASKLQLVIGTILNSIFSIQVFSLLSNYAAKGNFFIIKQKLSFFIRTMLFISIPVTFIVLIFGENIIRILFERGNFNKIDTILVSNYLKIYILALPAISIGAIVSQGLYIIPDTKSVMIVGLLETILYITICISTFQNLKELSIPIAYVLNFNISVLILIYILRKRLNHGGGIGIFISTIKIIMLSIIIGAIMLLIVKIIQPNDFIILFLCLFSLLFYIMLAKILTFKEVTSIYEKISEFVSKNKKLY